MKLDGFHHFFVFVRTVRNRTYRHDHLYARLLVRLRLGESEYFAYFCQYPIPMRTGHVVDNVVLQGNDGI